MKFNEQEASEKVRQFSDMMLARLIAHEGQGDWSDKPILSFYAKIVEKSVQIFKAIDSGDFSQMSKLCADGANFYMMLADRLGSINVEE